MTHWGRIRADAAHGPAGASAALIVMAEAASAYHLVKGPLGNLTPARDVEAVMAGQPADDFDDEAALGGLALQLCPSDRVHW